jgi:glycine hydroxymethyltransferase
MEHLLQADPELAAMIRSEGERIENTLDLIAAESHTHPAVLEALGSVFTTKTIEGYPGRRFHAGCVHADTVENLAVDRCKALFGADHANVQPHSGTSANLAVYFSVLDVGDRILSMDLSAGGHLSHGHRASVTSKCFVFDHYGIDPDTGCIDTEDVRRRAEAFRPKMIVAGASAYPRRIDYETLAKIAGDVSAYFFVDMAHLAGLVAARVIPSPVPYSDFVTFSCYKTLMGGRGGVILCRSAFARKVDSAIFPGCQGTSAVNAIAAKAVAFKLAREDRFVRLQQLTLDNAGALAAALADLGFGIVTGGTDNHQVLVDLTGKNISGAEAETVLESVGMVANRNVIPADAGRPGRASGLRLGTSAISARGMGSGEMTRIAEMIHRTLNLRGRPDALNGVAREVGDLCHAFPVYGAGMGETG